ncbi:MAG: TrkH family potassium uptake protein [Selenomonadaceae bacterium]
MEKNSGMFNFLHVSKWDLNPYQVLTLGFTVLIILGSVLLMLPIASTADTSMPFIDALFTATSAVCVTGLVVVDVGNYFTLFGQFVILLLIQAGGLGVMTLTTLMAVVLGRRIQLRDRMLIQESLNCLDMKGVVRLVIYITKVTFLIEFLGGTVLALRFAADYGWTGIYYGYWHAVSAFCNAGFDVFGGTTLCGYVDDPVVTFTLAGLIVFGGIGFAVMEDIWRNRSWRKIAVQTKVVLVTTIFLLALGTVGVFLLEYKNTTTIGNLSIAGKLLASFFQSVTARTAGFSMFDTGGLGDSALVFMLILMFIGASPGSTGGGIKTSTLAVIAAAIWSFIRGKDEVTLFNRAVASETILKALAIFFLSATLVFFVTMYLCVAENIPALKIVFEVVSAFATVGLSTGITPDLSSDGKFVLIIMMLIGRVGVFTFAMSIALKKEKNKYHHPMGKFTIG